MSSTKSNSIYSLACYLSLGASFALSSPSFATPVNGVLAEKGDSYWQYGGYHGKNDKPIRGYAACSRGMKAMSDYAWANLNCDLELYFNDGSGNKLKTSSTSLSNTESIEFNCDNGACDNQEYWFKVTSKASHNMANFLQNSSISDQSDGSGEAFVFVPPEDAVYLMDSTAWENTSWPINDGVMSVGGGDNRTKKAFGDVQIHVEWQAVDDPSVECDQGDGNSGFYIGDRYEIQVLHVLRNDQRRYCDDPPAWNQPGGLYEIAAAPINLYNPSTAKEPEQRWNSYDIFFYAAKYGADGRKTQNARALIYWNGTLIHNWLELPQQTGGGIEEPSVSTPNSSLLGQIRLQDHGEVERSQFRNIWVAPIKKSAQIKGGVAGGPGDGKSLTQVHPSFDLMDLRPDAFTEKVGAMEFLPDGRLLVSTWTGTQTSSGKLFLLDNVDQDDRNKITVKEIASGFEEPLGMKYYQGAIYLSEKFQITELKDTDGDDIIDEKNVFSTGFPATRNFHNFSFGLEVKDGYFWLALSNCVILGGNQCGANDPENVKDRGSLVRVHLPGTANAGDWEITATGLRTPNGMGVGVDGELFGGDNQGTWLPANKINHYRTDQSRSDFHVNYGHYNTIKSTYEHLTPVPPAIYLDHDTIGNSPSQPALLIDGSIYENQMVHGDVRHGGLKRDYLEVVNGQYQGAVFRFSQGLEAGINRVIRHNGDIYVGGIGEAGNWNQTGKFYYGLQRLRPNGKTTFEMLAMRSRNDGFEVEFTVPVDYDSALNPANYEVHQWHYNPSPGYGGSRADQQELHVTDVKLSHDFKKVHLKIAGLTPGKVVYLRLHNIVSSSGHYPWTTEAFYTLNNISSQKGPAFSVATGKPEINTRAADNPENIVNGLQFAKYKGTWDRLPDFNSLDPVLSGNSNNFNIGELEGEDSYGMTFEGYIDIQNTEMVTFYLNSDDGSRLYIGDQLVVDNDGAHGAIERSGSIALEAGKHAVRVEYFEFNGGAVLEAAYASSSISKTAIPSSALYREDKAIETADFDATSAELKGACIENNHLGHTGSGFVGCMFKGNSVVYKVDVGFAGDYDLTTRYSHGTNPGDTTVSAKIDVIINGELDTTLTLPVTGGWANWSSVADVIRLSSGVNTLEFKNNDNDSSSVNLDSFHIEKRFTQVYEQPNAKTCTSSNFGIDCRQDAPAYMAFPETDPKGDYNHVPPRLSLTGAFTDMAALTPSISLVPFDPIAPLWSDRAKKYRWIAVPTGKQITWSENDDWLFPAGTVTVKHFELPLDENKPSITRRLETRFLIKTENSWYGLTYKWREDGSDADLITEGLEESFIVTAKDGSEYSQTWGYPSSTDCMTCHNPFSQVVLGTKTGQLNGDYTYEGNKTANQLETWSHLGLFDTEIHNGEAENMVRFAHISDTSASLETRVRSYWDSNCSQCHGPDDTIPSLWDARFSTAAGEQGVVWGKVISEGHTTYVVEPKRPENSELHRRDGLRGAGQMPPLGTSMVDETYMTVLTEWINNLETEQTNDSDKDGINDDVDNCPLISNEGQYDKDNDNIGNECDDDIDGDGFTNQQERDAGTKEWDPLSKPGGSNDSDNDGIDDGADNCPAISNAGQWDRDGDGIGNECDNDIDGDGFTNQQEHDAGTKPWDPSSKPGGANDGDSDGVNDDADNCPAVSNSGQWDKDGDGIGNECDNDIDGDGFTNQQEHDAGTKPWDPSSKPGGSNDSDSDGVNDDNDNCPSISNAGQWDKDGDGIGNECDDDIDGDGFSNAAEDAAGTKAWDANSHP